MTKHITGKQRGIHFFDVSAPPFFRFVGGKESLVTLARKQEGCGTFPASSDLDRITTAWILFRNSSYPFEVPFRCFRELQEI